MKRLLKRTNHNYCRIEDGELIYAPSVLKINGKYIMRPTRRQYSSLGWRRKVILLPDGYGSANAGALHRGKTLVEDDWRKWDWDAACPDVFVTLHEENDD